MTADWNWSWVCAARAAFFSKRQRAFRNAAVCHLRRWLNWRASNHSSLMNTPSVTHTLFMREKVGVGSRSFPLLQLGSHRVGMMVIRESFCLHKNPSSANVHSLTPPPAPSEAHRPVLTLPQSLPVSVLTRPPYCNMGAGRTRPVTSVMSLCTTMPNSFR